MADKENATRRSYASLQLQRKQAVVANNVPAALPRVAALAAAGPGRRAGSAASQRSPLRDGKPARPPSSLKSISVQHTTKLPGGSMPRMGFKPATHSTRTLAPLLDVMAPAPGVPAPTPASAGSAVPQPIPAISPVSASPLASTIGDPSLDDAEAALQAELELADRRLEVLQSQQLHRRSTTPEAEAAPADMALLAGAVTPPVAPPASPAAPPPASQEVRQQQPPQQAAVEDLLPLPPAQEPPPIPPEDQSIVRSITTATGTGCKDVIAAHTRAVLPHSACWTTRGHRVLHLESACILQLWGRCIPDITLRITFADAASVPRLVRLEHAPSPTAAFERLGDIMLQPKSLKQLRHLFRLGKSLEVQRFLRITLVGHMAEVHSGAHRVSHMLLTSGQGPQRTQSALSGATAGGTSFSAASAQASVNHGRLQQVPAADSAASGTPVVPAAAPVETNGCSSAAAIGTPPLPATSSAAEAQAMADVFSLASAVAPLPAALSARDQQAQAEQAPPSAAPSYAGSSTSGSSADDEEERQSAAEEDHPATKPGGRPLPQAAWGTLEDAEQAEVDFALLAAEFGGGSPEAQQQQQPQQQPQLLAPQQQQQAPQLQAGRHQGLAAPAAPVMLLPMQRCGDVEAILSGLDMSPKQACNALLRVVELSSEGVDLSDEQLDNLLRCMPSLQERALLQGFTGNASQLGSAEQLMLELLQVPAVAERVEARRFAAQAAARINAAACAATLLDAACTEVAQSDLLRTLLKVALLAANFLNAGNQNGAAAGFQIDALLKLKEVRSSRSRSRTLLHFVAREVARQHPEGACLKAALPSAAAAAGLDIAAAKADLLELSAGARQVEQVFSAALEGCCDAGTVAQLGAFRSGVVERLAGVLEELDGAEAAFRHLGSFINAQKATLADPKAFFGVLHAFAEELAGAHRENAAADAAAGQPATKPAGQGKDSKPRSQGKAPSPSGDAAASQGMSRRWRHDSTGSAGSVQDDAGSAGQHAERHSLPPAAAALERLRQASLERLAGTAPAADVGTSMESMAAMRQRKQHSPQPCMSKAAIAGIGGSRCGGGGGPGSGGNGSSNSAASPLAVSRVDAAPLLAQASSPGAAGADDAPAKVAALLAESARIMSSMDAGQGGGFGSAFGSAGAAAGAAAEDDTAATPDGAVRAAGTAAEGDAGFSTPRDSAVPLRWLEQQQQQAAAAQQEQQRAEAGQLHGHLRYRAMTTTEEEAGADAAAAPAAVPAGRLAASHAASMPPRASQHAASFSQLRQRSLQHLSPTSTPLSSLGRQSSRCSSAYSDGGSTPRSSLPAARGSLLHRSTSPLGLDVSGVAADASPATAAKTSAAAVAAGQQAGLPGLVAADPLAAEGRLAAEGQAAVASEQVLPAREFGASALHSRASSCDLTYYAPFSMDREGPGAFAAPGAQAPQGLSSSFCYGQEPAGAWGPLAAQQERVQAERASRLVRHTSADEGMLAAAAAATERAEGTLRAAFSLPSSPRCGADVASASRRPPPPLNLRGVSDRLQLSAQHAMASAAAGQRQLRESSGPCSAAYRPQQAVPPLSPVMEALLPSGPTPAVPAQQEQAELAADDLADLAGFSSDHEAEWQQLERMEQLDAEWHRQQAAERAVRELLLLQPALGGQHAVQQVQQAQQHKAQRGRAEADAQAEVQPAVVQPLPSPIKSGTADLDAAMARLLASAGNTPTGPLGLGLRSAPADGSGAAAAEQGGAVRQAVPVAGGRQVALLEPLVPAPLGEGIRASNTLAKDVPAAALRLSVEGPRAMLRQSQPRSSLTEEAEHWAGAAAAGYTELPSSSSMLSFSNGGSRYGGSAEWGPGAAGVGPIRRRRGLGRFLPIGSRA